MNSAGKHSRKAPSSKNIPNFTRENKQQGTAAIIHSPSYFWRLSEEQSQSMSDHLPQQHFHQWVTFWTPPHLNSCLPLAGAAACPKGSSGFVTGARSHSTRLLLWKQHACCTSKDMPRQQLSLLSCGHHPTIPFAIAPCPSPSFHLGCFLFPFQSFSAALGFCFP